MLTDGGLKTTLIFDLGFDLPEFASFPLLESESGRKALLDYYRTYTRIAEDHGVGIVLDTPTWRASADWARSSATTPRPSTGSTLRQSISFARSAPSSSPAARRWSSRATSGPGATATTPATR